MIKSTRFFAVAALTGFAVLATAMAAAPLGASANAAAITGYEAARIGGAFASIPDVEPSQALTKAAKQAVKGDREPVRGCAAATWPNIDRACLVTVDGRPAPAVRTITIGYQEGGSTTVLVRVPAAEIASR